MTLRIKILGFISAMIVAMIIILYVCVKIIVLSNSTDIELQIATDNAMRVSNFISYEMERTAGIAQTLAEWDDSILFVNGQSQNYEEDNLMDSAYLSMQLESIIYLNANGDIIYHGSYDLAKKAKIKNNPGFQQFIDEYKSEWLKLENKQNTTGMQKVGEEFFLYSARPIVNSKGEGPSYGVIITGRILDCDEVDAMNNILKTKIEIKPVTEEALEKMDGRDIFVEQVSPENQSASFILKDNKGHPVAIVTSYVDRFVYGYGQANLHYFLFSIILICIIVCIAILWLLDTNVLSKIQMIIERVNEIEETSNLSLRVNQTAIGSDELGKLSSSINSMLNTLETSRDDLEYLSMHDPLTGLYNRAKFEQGIEAIKKNSIICVTIMVCDVDGLKQVNDRKGHKEGDKLLIKVADILKKCFREEDKIYRIGGDEFAAILEVNNTEFIDSIYERVNSAIKEYNENNPEFHIGVSIGFACSTNQCYDIDTLFKQADNNMYKEKAEHHKR